jgi:hypothetical protein
VYFTLNMSNKLSEIADVLAVYEVMEGSNEDLDSIMDKYGDEPLILLWDCEPPKLADTQDITSDKHEWVLIKESEEESEVYIYQVEERAK